LHRELHRAFGVLAPHTSLFVVTLDSQLLLLTRVAPRGWVAFLLGGVMYLGGPQRYTVRIAVLSGDGVKELGIAGGSAADWQQGLCAQDAARSHLANLVASALDARHVDHVWQIALAALYTHKLRGELTMRHAAVCDFVPASWVIGRKYPHDATHFKLFNAAVSGGVVPVGWGRGDEVAGSAQPTAGAKYFLMAWCPVLEGTPIGAPVDPLDRSTLAPYRLGGWWAAIPILQGVPHNALDDFASLLRDEGWCAAHQPQCDSPVVLVRKAMRTAQGAGRIEASLTALLEP